MGPDTASVPKTESSEESKCWCFFVFSYFFDQHSRSTLVTNQLSNAQMMLSTSKMTRPLFSVL